MKRWLLAALLLFLYRHRAQDSTCPAHELDLSPLDHTGYLTPPSSYLSCPAGPESGGQ